MTFGDAVVSAFTKYAVFSGRARRAEFWYFWLFNAITVTSMFFIALLFDAGDAFAGLLVLYWLATIVPRYALIWRRLQDTGRSGFYFFLVFVPVVGWILVLIRLLMEGQRGPNVFGPDPKAS
ncbi:MAG: DUF805 domain-containing protein [Oscillospiraceae bacterium]|jgi:uncharacterized membrane protein YhaH (DUF805 family)|nr:DUF805 domain-containing protein [Oscillospiraceae bacterium]